MTRHTPIYTILIIIARLSLPLQIHTLRKLVALERPYSVRRNELQSLLAGKILKQLRKESRAA